MLYENLVRYLKLRKNRGIGETLNSIEKEMLILQLKPKEHYNVKSKRLNKFYFTSPFPIICVVHNLSDRRSTYYRIRINVIYLQWVYVLNDGI